MTAVVAGGSCVERLVCHGRLPLIAGLDAARPAVHVWESGPGGLRPLGVIDAGAAAYPSEACERYELIPSVAWHPHEPALVVTGAAGLRRWTAEGGAVAVGPAAGAAYRDIAFSPDGRSLWASPSSSGEGGAAWERSDALDLAGGAVRTGRAWDTGVVDVPGGGLVVTLASEQGATDVLFARPGDGVPAGMRVLRHAITLDVDGYEPPVFSADGRYLALRGNAYVQSLDVFSFPAMRRVLHTTFGEPYPGYPYPPQWLAEQARWSRHNIAFAAGSGALLAGTPSGTLIEIDLDGDRTREHSVTDAAISALAVLPTGRLVLADRSGRLAVMDAPGAELRDVRPAGAATACERVEAFLSATTELPDDADLETGLVRTDDRQ